MKRASYREAIRWIILNDDTDWIYLDDPISVTAALVADLFGVNDSKIRKDLKNAYNAFNMKGTS